MLTALLLALGSCGGLALAWGLLRPERAATAAPLPLPYVPQDDWSGLA